MISALADARKLGKLAYHCAGSNRSPTGHTLRGSRTGHRAGRSARAGSQLAYELAPRPYEAMSASSDKTLGTHPQDSRDGFERVQIGIGLRMLAEIGEHGGCIR
ncbi:hypothetical protein GCM10012284_64790 [Mangrovihabitans endophyticus]|uniref:Uncharacterized protein n=1 Tax=Mangrovihabitans endophyticus TaxID=1751298 RepID=A0A8J3C5E9_9ACTN|nr:hypothetical protein GCM10012284_64790 [Mangrovihabitans endophyticus]